ncbi:MFS transporter [Amycolatopsis echigonensis]|uniref:MFS transporter n=1 Tax=Amycolatopsis echigonensis TaxID=2576905 RepID=A0A2N3WSJ6_9PSEU|nr:MULTISPECIES: MFS transporter [Amycolatopsis]MBB2498662.1 MFS transporter [Amycolatopsis echigonensis]PKV96851.1 transmembrane secretion effector [Amycolatopsis niigatensis]
MKRRDAKLPAAYWRLWWASAVDNVGDGVFSAAVPLLTVTLTRDPVLVSVVSAATYLPWLLLSLPAGAVVDRRDRVGLLWRSQALQAAIVAAAAVLIGLGRIDIAALALMGFGLSACEVVFANASLAVLPDLVSETHLHRANGSQYAIANAGQLFVGPPIGSLLFAVAAALPFGVDATSFVVSAALLATLPRRPLPQIAHPPIRVAVAEGVRWLGRHRLLRTLAGLLAVNTFCYQLGNVTVVLLATQTLHVSERGYGVLLAGAAVGSVLGGMVNARVVAKIGALRALLTALIANVVIFVLIGASPNAVVLGLLLGLNGFATTLWSVVTVSLRQQAVPTELRGRVHSVYRMLGWGLMPLGSLAGGLVADAFGIRAAYPVAGAVRGIALAAALPVLLSAMRARRSAE